MINTSLKIAAAMILTGLVSFANAQMSEDEQCKQMATYADRSLFEELHKQGKCLNIKLGKSPSEVEERRQAKASVKPDLSKMSPVTSDEKSCIRLLYANYPLNKNCNEPESYYRDLMSGKVKSKGLEAETQSIRRYNQSNPGECQRNCLENMQICAKNNPTVEGKEMCRQVSGERCISACNGK